MQNDVLSEFLNFDASMLAVLVNPKESLTEKIVFLRMLSFLCRMCVTVWMMS